MSQRKRDKVFDGVQWVSGVYVYAKREDSWHLNRQKSAIGLTWFFKKKKKKYVAAQKQRRKRCAMVEKKRPFEVVVVNQLLVSSLLAQGHLRSTWDFPPSSYSCFEIHICWKEPSDARIEPPIQAPNLRSPDPLALMIFNLILFKRDKITIIKVTTWIALHEFVIILSRTWGVLADKSRFKRSEKPWSKELPPVTITLPYKLWDNVKGKIKLNDLTKKKGKNCVIPVSDQCRTFQRLSWRHGLHRALCCRRPWWNWDQREPRVFWNAPSRNPKCVRACVKEIQQWE